MSRFIDPLIFDRVQADVDQMTKKAYIAYDDLNRVENAVWQISETLNHMGYRNTIVRRDAWKMDQLRTEADIRSGSGIISRRSATHITHLPVRRLRRARITYTSIYQANAIEKILYDLGTLVDKIEPGHHHLGFRIGTGHWGTGGKHGLKNQLPERCFLRQEKIQSDQQLRRGYSAWMM